MLMAEREYNVFISLLRGRALHPRAQSSCPAGHPILSASGDSCRPRHSYLISLAAPDSAGYALLFKPAPAANAALLPLFFDDRIFAHQATAGHLKIRSAYGEQWRSEALS